MHDPGSPGIGFVPSQADRSAPVSGAGQLPRYLRGAYRDATPLLTGSPQPASGPRHSAEPAPGRTLAARYRSADPIDLDGATVYPMYSEQLATPASALTMTLLSATPPAGLTAVGIGLSILDGYIDLDDRCLTGVDIWRDALERGITFDLAADSPDALFALTPVWSDAAGEPRSWSGNYGIVVERTENDRTVLWCSMGEGPPHFADLVIEVRNTALDPHPHLFMSGAIPTVSTAAPPEHRRNRHHWVETDESAPAAAHEPDPWAAHYEPAGHNLSTRSVVDEPSTTAATSQGAPAAEDCTSESVTDDSTTGSLAGEPEPPQAAHEPAPAPTAVAFLSAPTVSTPTGYSLIPTVSTPTTHTTDDSPPTSTTADPATAISPVLSETGSAPTATTPPPVPTVSAATASTAAPTGYDYLSISTTADLRVSPAPGHTASIPPVPESISFTTAGSPPAATPSIHHTHSPAHTATDHDPLSAPAPTTHDALSPSPVGNSSDAASAEQAASSVATDHPAELAVNDTARALTASGPGTEPDGGGPEISGYPCSFADIRLAAPAYEIPPHDTSGLETTTPHRALVEGCAGYDDPLTETGAGGYFPEETGSESSSDAGRHGWAESPELTGLVPVIRDAELTDYGSEPLPPVAAEAAIAPPLYRHPLLAGTEPATEFALHAEHSFVDTLADDAFAPVPPIDRPAVDDETDPARLHSLGAVAYARGDDDRAHLLWTRAAHAGHLGALYDLGALSLRRDDRDAAERWWRAAAGRRIIPAMAELAALLEERGAVAEARMWRTQAVAEEVIATAARRRPAAGENRWTDFPAPS